MQGGEAAINRHKLDKLDKPPSYADRTTGTELTRFEPVFIDDGEGGKRFRVITDDGEVFHGSVSREAALRMIATLALFVAKDIASER